MPIFPGSSDELDARMWADLTAALEPKYQLIRPVGRGGMGAVLLAHEPALDRNVAIKVLAPALAADPTFRQRFQMEGRAAAAISHPNVVQVYTVGETAGSPPLPFIILQFVDGDPLDKCLRHGGPMTERRARRLLRDIAAGLAAAHARNLVHLDVKPGNVLVEHVSGRAMLVDFGLAAAVSAQTPAGTRQVSPGTGPQMGTPLYMSPEQLLGEGVGPPSDVFSLGLLADELLSGPLSASQASPRALLGTRSTRPPLADRRPGLSADLTGLLARCEAADPAARPAAAELVGAFVPSLDDGIAWPPPGLEAPSRRARAASRWAVVTASGVALLVAALAARLPGTHTASGWWRAWGDDGLIISAASGPSSAVVAAWHFAIGAGLLLAVAGVISATRVLLQLGREVNGVRRLGWRWATLLDALADPDGRSGQVIGGTADFVALSERLRHRIRDCRRIQFGSRIGALIWAAACLLVWTVGLLTGSPPSPAGGPLVGQAGAAVALGPLVLLAALHAAVQALEKRALGDIPWRRAHTSSFPVPTAARNEDVAEWYRDLGTAPVAMRRTGPPSEAIARVSRVAAWAGAILLAGAMVAATAATLVAARVARHIGAETARAASLGRLGGGVDSTAWFVEPVALLAANQPADTGLIRGLLDGTLPRFAIDPRLALGSPDRALARKTLVADAIRRGRSLPADSLAALATVAAHPRTRAVRELAREPAGRWPIGTSSLTALREALEANGAAAAVAVSRGHVDSARRRLIENAAVARQMAAGPDRLQSESGLLFLETTYLLPLEQLEQGEGKEALAATAGRAARIVAEQRARYGADWSIGAVGLASDPRDLSEFVAILQDRTIPIGYRTSLREAFVDGLCLRPRYLLVGEVDVPPSLASSAQLPSRPWWKRFHVCARMGG